MLFKRFCAGLLSAALLCGMLPGSTVAATPAPFFQNGDYLQLLTPDELEHADAAPSGLPFYTAIRQPDAYDLRTTGCITPVKDQGNTGMCVAFSVLGSVESNLIRQGLAPDTANLSETHLSYYPYTAPTDPLDPLYGDCINIAGKGSAGGNAQLATAALAAGIGPQTEEFCPFSTWGDVYSEYQRYSSRFRLKKAETIQTAPTANERSILKNWILNNGAVSFAFYSARSLYYDNGTSHAYYAKGKSFYSNANHAALIVGWDDHYSKENFKPGSQPQYDGAWLVRNSWSTDLLDDGYFWISYEDPTMGAFYSFTMEAADAYDDIYQYDGVGYLTAYDFQAAANVFTAETDCTLEQVGFYLTGGNDTNSRYTVKVYAVDADAEAPTDGRLLGFQSGSLSYHGYRTIALNTPIPLSEGQSFSVVLSLRNTSGSNAYIAIEENDTANSNFGITYHANPGESYIQEADGQWYDTTRKSGQYGSFGNVCLKAMTRRTESAAEVVLPSLLQALAVVTDPEALSEPAVLAFQQAKAVQEEDSASLLEQQTAARTLLAMLSDSGQLSYAAFPDYTYPRLDTIPGDCDQDTTVTISDASAVLSYYAKKAAGLPARTTRKRRCAMDFDADGTIQIQDAAAILEYYAYKAAGIS